MHALFVTFCAYYILYFWYFQYMYLLFISMHIYWYFNTLSLYFWQLTCRNPRVFLSYCAYIFE